MIKSHLVVKEDAIKPMLISKAKLILEKYHPSLLHFIYYYKSYQLQKKDWVDIDPMFLDLICRSKGKSCLQIGARLHKYSDDFVCVDLYDTADYVDYHYDIHDMKFEDGTFDLIVCNAVLEHVISPQLAIEEMSRVLKPGGEIWIEVPLNQPYHPCPDDYWRVTIKGLEVWMKNFEKISSGIFGSMFYNGVYFHGAKSV